MTFDETVRQEGRLIILKALTEQPDGRLNSSLLQEQLKIYGLTKSREWVHDQLNFLRSMGAVDIVEAGSVRIATVSARGQRHVDREEVIEGVKRPSRPEV